VTIHPDTRTQATENSSETSQLDDLRTAWVVGYRRRHAEADRWAEGVWAVEHSVKTQERVFRMAEQLAGRGVDQVAVFAALRQADWFAMMNSGGLSGIALQPRHLYTQGRAVRTEDFRHEPWRRTLTAAIAGCGVIDTLLGEQGVVVNLLPPEAFEKPPSRNGRYWVPQSQAGRVMILMNEVPELDHLRAFGFDPITFDGADPAAFAWAIFELTSRAEAAATQLGCDCHPSAGTVLLGVAVDGSSRSLTNPTRVTAAMHTRAYA